MDTGGEDLSSAEEAFFSSSLEYLASLKSESLLRVINISSNPLIAKQTQNIQEAKVLSILRSCQNVTEFHWNFMGTSTRVTSQPKYAILAPLKLAHGPDKPPWPVVFLSKLIIFHSIPFLTPLYNRRSQCGFQNRKSCVCLSWSHLPIPLTDSGRSPPPPPQPHFYLLPHYALSPWQAGSASVTPRCRSHPGSSLGRSTIGGGGQHREQPSSLGSGGSGSTALKHIRTDPPSNLLSRDLLCKKKSSLSNGVRFHFGF